jgi:putative transposase
LVTCRRLKIGLLLSYEPVHLPLFKRREVTNLPYKLEKFFAEVHSFFMSSMSTFHRRRLPHYHAIGQPIFLTWRLYGSLPANRSFPAVTDSGRAFVTIDHILDNACTGPLFLKRPEIPNVVVEAIQYRDLRQFELHSYVVMPNHVHLLMTPLVNVCDIMQSLKRLTARECNKVLGLTGGPFWQNESYDRLVRDETEFLRIVRYIETNPVKAGLATTPEVFLWSSASPIFNRRQVTNLPYKATAIEFS